MTASLDGIVVEMSVACLSEVSTAVCDGVAVLCALTAKAVYRVVRPGGLDMLLLAARSKDMMASVMEVNEGCCRPCGR